MKKLNLVFFLALFVFFLLPSVDPDLGWHLRCGQEIWQEHTFCNVNHFSVLLENYSWVNHFWLYQAILFPVYQFFGLWGLSFLNSIIVTLAFFFFYQTISNFAFEKMAASLLIIFISWGVFSFGIRGQLMGFLFFNLLLFLLSKIKEKPKLAIFLPLTMLFWANMHGSIILGLILLGFFYLKQVLNLLSPPSKNAKLFALFSFFFAFSAIVTLVNPFGFTIYQEAWQHMFGQIDLSKLIAEWVPPNPNVYWTIIISAFALLLYFLITAAPREIIFGFLLLPFAFLAMKARRHVHFYFLIFFYLFFTLSASKKILAVWQKQKILRGYLAVLTALLFLGVSFSIGLPRTYRANKSWGSYCQASPVTVPCEAIDFLKKQNTQGNIFNRYEWGGFLIWQLPAQKIFVDGRMPAWENETDKSPYTIYLEILQTRQIGGQTQPGWEKTLEEYKIDWILISPGTFMDLLLQPNPEKFGWQEVYRDKISVIYNRTSQYLTKKIK